MRTWVVIAVILICMGAQAQDTKPFSLRAHLLAELHSTHDVKEWFVPANIAVAGLTAKQASWTDGSGNHSVGQLANHLVFWNARQLATIRGQKNAKFSGDNTETFNAWDGKSWDETVKRLDQVLRDLEHEVEIADEAKLVKLAPVISHIATHNAYHVGQMIFVRKLAGNWDAENGVKA